MVVRQIVTFYFDGYHPAFSKRGPEMSAAVENVVPSFLNRSLFDKTKACRRMFERVSDAAYDAVCQNEGQQDFLR